MISDIQRFYNKMTAMLTTSIEIILKIFDTSRDKEKVYVAATCKQLNSIMDRLIFFQKVRVTKITHLPYFDNFKHVEIGDFVRYPKYVTHVTFGNSFDNPIVNKMPSSVTHVTFGRNFNRSFSANMLSSVTHLTFGHHFNQPLKLCMPQSVTHLIFGRDFDQPIVDCIPDSVTHLTFGYYFNQSLKRCIPLSVTHLTFGHHFNQPLKSCIPSSVTHITFGYWYRQPINSLPRSIEKILLHTRYTRQIDSSILSKVARHSNPIVAQYLSINAPFASC